MKGEKKERRNYLLGVGRGVEFKPLGMQNASASKALLGMNFYMNFPEISNNYI